MIMTTVNITDFKRNIWTYFDQIICTKKPIIIKRRNLQVKITPINNTEWEAKNHTEDEVLNHYALQDYIQNTPEDSIKWEDYIVKNK
jgi:PHD/YefM family antitoxin component YafN of YafNO toxin-antitoxin module